MDGAVTSRDWTQIATVLAVLRQRVADHDRELLDEVARSLARSFAETSTRFDEDRFLRIVGVRSG